MNVDRVNFNSFDVFYDRKFEIYIPSTRHVIKVYLDTLDNKKVQEMVLSLKSYDFIYFFRSNILKQFITKKMQDNLIGEYGKDYKHFSLNGEEYKSYIRKYENHHVYFLNIFARKTYIPYDADSNNFIISDKLLSLKCFKTDKFQDAFDENTAKKYIINYDSFKLENPSFIHESIISL